MVGKAALLLMSGMIILLTSYQQKMGNISTRAGENFLKYYSKEVAHQMAVSGVNIAATKVYRTGHWNIERSYTFQDGVMKTALFSDTTGFDTVLVGTVSNYKGYIDTVVAYFGFLTDNAYSKYVMFTNSENGVAWKPGDEVWGPLHTNGVINHMNDSTIIFHGKVTAGKGIFTPPKNARTQFLGGYEVGVYLPDVTNMDALINAATAGGYKFPSSTDTMKIEFKADGNVVVYQNSTAIFPEPGTPIYTLAPNGAIYTEGPLVILGGDVNTSSKGLCVGSGENVILQDDIAYANDPTVDPNSDDILGIVAWDDIVFDNTSKANWDLQAALMAVNGSLTAIDMTKAGTFDYFGSIYQKVKGNAKMFQSFNKNYIYDERLATKPPPFYPGASVPKPYLIAWYE